MTRCDNLDDKPLLCVIVYYSVHAVWQNAPPNIIMSDMPEMRNLFFFPLLLNFLTNRTYLCSTFSFWCQSEGLVLIDRVKPTVRSEC